MVCFWFVISVIKCKDLAVPDHGSKECDNDKDIYGTNCTFSCDTGYKLTGYSKSSCERNGSFNHQTPTCHKSKYILPILFCVSVNVRFCMLTHTYTHTHPHIRTYTYIHTRTSIHTYIHTLINYTNCKNQSAKMYSQRTTPSTPLESTGFSNQSTYVTLLRFW